MTLADIYTMLTSITGFTNKVVYREWPVGEAPALPFITYEEGGTENFAADGIVYTGTREIDIELYSKMRDEASEALIESKLTANGLFWDKNISYIDSEKCYQVLYELEV